MVLVSVDLVRNSLDDSIICETVIAIIEHRDNQTGQTETYRANGLSDIGDEYNDLTGRQFSDGSYDQPTLKRGDFSGDKIEGIGDN